MKKPLLAALLALPLSVIAATQHPDGSVTFTKEEIADIARQFQATESEYFAAQSKLVDSQDLVDDLKKQLDALKKAGCT
jgi:hypothetical protein